MPVAGKDRETEMPQTLCQLGTFQFQFNAPDQKNPAPKSVQHVTTLGGGVNTVWPVFAQDRVITLSWPTLNFADYNSLETQKNLPGTLSFTDWLGVAYSVLVLDLTHTTILRGGVDAYTSVVLVLRVISQP